MSNRLKRPASPPPSAKIVLPPQIKPKLSWLLGIFGTLILLAVLLAALSTYLIFRHLHHS